MQKDLFLGIDIGSVTIKTALISMIRGTSYLSLQPDQRRSHCRPCPGTRRPLSVNFQKNVSLAAGITGSGGKQIAEVIGARFVNEILAQAEFAGTFTRMRGPSSRWAARTPS